MKKVALILVAMLMLLLCAGAMAEGEIEIVQQGYMVCDSALTDSQIHLFAEIKNVSNQNVEMKKSYIQVNGQNAVIDKFVPDVLLPGETGYAYGHTFRKVDGEVTVELALEWDKTRMAPLEKHEVKGRLVSVNFKEFGLIDYVPAVTITNKSGADITKMTCLAAAYDADGKLLMVLPVEIPNGLVIPADESATLQMLSDSYTARYVLSSGMKPAEVKGVAVIPFE